MKKKILIPGKKNFPKIGTPIKKVTEVEKIPMSQIFEEAKFDRTRMAFFVNVIFSLADIVNGLAVDAESELKNVDPELRLELRHPIERIKIHSSELVRFVDEKTSESFSEGFGEAADEVREMILGYYGKLMKK